MMLMKKNLLFFDALKGDGEKALHYRPEPVTLMSIVKTLFS